MTEPRCWAVFRERDHSPGREDDDAEILRATGARLEQRGIPVRYLEPDALCLAKADPAPALAFTMCERPDALDTLAAFEAKGTVLVNSLAAVENTFRHRMIPLLKPLAPRFPESRLLDADAEPPADTRDVWVKRGDYHQTQKGDVAFARDAAEAKAAMAALAARGIARAVLQAHVPGDIIKFYGVGVPGRTPAWFHHFPHRNQDLQGFPFEEADLRGLVREAAALMGLEVYGGDVIVTPESDLVLIDINAWPSFALVRDEAAEAITAHIAARLSQEVGT